MQGFIDKNGGYYEADDPLNKSDVRVELRPSDLYIMGPNGWVIDRRALAAINSERAAAATQAAAPVPAPAMGGGTNNNNNAQTFQPNININHPPMPYPMSPPQQAVPAVSHAEEEEKVSSAFVKFFMKNWIILGTIAVWAITNWISVSMHFKDIDVESKAMKAKIEDMQKDQKDAAKLVDTKLSSLESRYSDLNLFLQQMINNNRPNTTRPPAAGR